MDNPYKVLASPYAQFFLTSCSEHRSHSSRYFSAYSTFHEQKNVPFCENNMLLVYPHFNSIDKLPQVMNQSMKHGSVFEQNH